MDLMKTNEHISRYEEIAYLIAKRIVSGDIKENDKLRGRSLLSSEYNVSSETVRKAMLLLSNHQVVDVKERSGIYVTSRDHAKAYVKHFEHHEVRKSIAEETQMLLDESLSINQKLQKKFKQIVSSYEKDVFPFVYFTCRISEDHPFLGHSFESLKIYDKAKGLIIAYEFDGALYQIPNPKTTLKAEMTLYILGDKQVKEKVFAYFNQTI
jgi:DNA-binding transcriptional regulator YhcF (GntR family)